MTRAEAEHATEVLSKANVDIATLIRYLDNNYYTGMLVAMGEIMQAMMRHISEEELTD